MGVNGENDHSQRPCITPCAACATTKLVLSPPRLLCAWTRPRFSPAWPPGRLTASPPACWWREKGLAGVHRGRLAAGQASRHRADVPPEDEAVQAGGQEARGPRGEGAGAPVGRGEGAREEAGGHGRGRGGGRRSGMFSGCFVSVLLLRFVAGGPGRRNEEE